MAYQTCDWEASNSPSVISVVSGSQPQGSRTNPKQLAFFHMLLMELDKKNPSAQKKKLPVPWPLFITSSCLEDIFQKDPNNFLGEKSVLRIIPGSLEKKAFRACLWICS